MILELSDIGTELLIKNYMIVVYLACITTKVPADYLRQQTLIVVLFYEYKEVEVESNDNKMNK